MESPRIETPLSEATEYAASESAHDEETKCGVTDGKAVSAYLEQKFKRLLNKKNA